ncbi:MAG: hypothetical protein JNK05_32965 [Myxococcales bacterium]|nr:hypothetical protein [Myxococcales bacterium]
MSADPKLPSPLSTEARELLRAAAKPRPMTLVERKVAAHAVAKIAAAPVGLVAGGVTAAKLATGVAVVGASVATIVTAQSVANRPAPQRTTITQSQPARVARSTNTPIAPVLSLAPAAPIAPVAPIAPIAVVAPPVAPLRVVPTVAPSITEPARRSNELSARVQVNRVPARPFVAPSAISSTSQGLPLPEQTLAQPQEQRENNALQQVMATIARDPAAALAMLDAFDRDFPRGRLRDEREFLGVLALDRSGRQDEARARAQAFLERAPTSMYAPRLRRLLNRSQ